MRPGEFREVVGRVQLPDRFFPASAIHQIVPIGNEIVDGTSGLAERHAAIHAARALRAKVFFRKIEIDLEPVVDALRHWTPRCKFARVFQEPGGLTHVAPAQAATSTGRGGGLGM